VIVANQALPNSAIDGFVERLDELGGIEGWAVDRDDPTRVLDVELWAGGTLLARTNTGGERADVCASLNLRARPGFRFDHGVCTIIRSAAADGLTGNLTVRVADSTDGEPLPGASRNLEIVALGLAGATTVAREPLLELLAIHMRAARRSLEQALPSLPASSSGVLEALAADESGFIWVSGWLADDGIIDRPVTILDDGRHAAALAYVPVPREDLAHGQIGFVGVLHTDWRPASAVPPSLLMADADNRLLEPLLPSPVSTRQAMAPLIAHSLAQGRGPYRDALRDVFHAAPRWSLPEDRSSADLLQIDEVAVLPGFGALVKGWALSSTKDVESFAAKVGSRVLAADPRSIARHPRGDLASVYPSLGDTTDMAGFVAIFRGSFDAARLEDLIVQVTWSDGSRTNDRAVPNTIRVLGLTAPLGDAYRFYPDLEASYFFADFAHHAALTSRAHARDIRAYDVQPAGEVLILAVPSSASDLFLMYDNLLRHAAELPRAWGIAILAESDHLRPLVVSLYADIRRVTGRSSSLFFTRRGRPSNEAIEPVLDALGAARFAFIGDGVSLAPDAWGAIAAAGDDAWLLGATDLATPGAGSVECDAFVTNRGQWRELIASAPPRIGGIALPRDGTFRTMTNAAFILEGRSSTPLIARINRANGAARD
jgi:hypothetical protein